MKITFPFVIIHRTDYAQLKSLRNLLKVIMDMRSDQRALTRLGMISTGVTKRSQKGKQMR